MSRRIQDLLKKNTDSHETIIKSVVQSDSSILELVSLMILMHSRLHELGLRAIGVGGAGDCFLIDLYHINDMSITTIICKSVVLEFNI